MSTLFIARHAIFRRLLLLLALCNIWACSFPGVYKLDVQQGNVVTQDMVNQLKPGMSKRQVRYIMGTPLLVDSFDPDRWDYFYSLKNHEDEYSHERLTLRFSNDQLMGLEGNFRPVQAAEQEINDAAVPVNNPSNVQVYPVSPP